MSAKYNAHTNDLFKELGILKLDDVYKLNVGNFFILLYEKWIAFTYYEHIYTCWSHINTSYQIKHKIQPQNRHNVVASQCILHNKPQIWSSIPMHIYVNPYDVMFAHTSFTSDIKDCLWQAMEPWSCLLTAANWELTHMGEGACLTAG